MMPIEAGAGGIRGYLENKANEEQLKDYRSPLAFFILRFVAFYILTLALALRLTRASAEAAGLVVKEKDTIQR